VIKKIHEIHPSAKIIILSAYAKHQIEPLLGTVNIFSIIEKPFRSEQIKAIAKKALDSQKLKEGDGNETG